MKTWDIVSIDTPVDETGLTLRAIITSIRQPSNPTKQLFHGINKPWGDDGSFMFSFAKHNEDIARNIITGLVSFIRAKYNIQGKHSGLDRNFSQSALDRAHTCVWDPVKKAIITTEDKMLQDLSMELEEDGQDFLFEFADDQPAPQVVRTTPGPNPDSESVDTFGTKRQTFPSVLVTPKPAVATKPSSPTQSTQGSTMTHTVVSQLSQQMEDLSSKVSAISKDYQHLLFLLEQRLPTNLKDHSDSGTTTATNSQATINGVDISAKGPFGALGKGS